jgi:hypothetical protein
MRAIRCSIVLALLALAVAPAAGASPPQPVTVDMHGHLTGPSTIEGTWTASGAFTDSGTYTESFRLDGRTVHTTKRLSGARGTLQLRAQAVVIYLTPTFATFKAGNWRITDGSGAYEHLHAGGTPGVTSDTFADLASGIAHMVHVGEAHD